MRVVIVCVPGVGHVATMVPLARRLKDSGHAVLLLTGPDFVATARAWGFDAAAAGPTRAQARAERLARHPESVELAPREQQRFHVAKVWAGIYAPRTLPDLLSAARSWHPDVLVYDVASFSGPLAADLLGIPGVDHSFCPGFPDDVFDLARAELADLWASHGRDVPPRGGMLSGLHIDMWPESLAPPERGRPKERIGIRTVDAGTAGREGAPLVHFTMGTVFNQNPPLFRTVIEALAGQGLEVCITTGPDQDPAVLGPLPEGMRAERFVPHAELVPRCSLVIGHGGAGTTMAAIGNGVPLLVLPQAADQFDVAESVAGAGAGLFLEPDALTVPAVRTSVRRLLTEPGFGAAAERLKGEIAAMPGPQVAVAAIEDQVG